jgi:riboflavin biosynthesis protein RibD
MDFLLDAFRQSFYSIGNSDPNPPVGAILVSQTGEILGKGYTQVYGGPHAEVMAINQASPVADEETFKNATLYVTLEPCSHFGKTPPCTNLIIEKKIGNVVIASYDENEKVNGIDILRQNNINVQLADISKYRNEMMWTIDAFHFNLKKKRPRIWLKWAQTKNGFLGPISGPSGNITGPVFKEIIHRLRKMFHGILVTPGTIRADMPMLTPRYGSLSIKKYFQNDIFSDLMQTFENNYPEEFRNIQKRFFLMPEILDHDEDRYRQYVKMQNKAGGTPYFFYSHESKFYKDLEINKNQKKIDFNNIDEIIRVINAEGCLNLLIEAGAVFAQKFIQSGYVDFIIAAKSKESKWENGKSFNLSKALSDNNTEEFEKNMFEKIYENQFENDAVYFFRKKN